MATITRSKTWVSNETLTASDLNAEFDNVISGANSFDQANLSKTDDYTMASLIVGTGITSTDGDSVHIHPSSAGDVTADTTGDELVIEKANDVGMSFLCPNNASASIFFGDADTNNKGSIIYDHGTDMAFTVEATEVLSLSATVATLSSQLTVGVNDTGHDVKFFGATSGAYWLWDESADGVVQIGTLTVGVDDAGHDVKFFGDAASAFMLWDTSTDDLVLGGAAQLYLYDAAGGEHISSDGTDLTINSGRNINLTCASGDVVIPANIGLTFGSGEKIEGDSTDLTITSGAKINLTATSDIVVPADVGITFGTGEKIEGDSTDLTVTSGGAINLTATTDVVVPANVGVTFGSGEKIEGDNTDLTVTSGGLITLTATGNTVVTNALLLSGATQANSTITVGVDDAGYDVTFFGNAASAFMLWDASTDDLVLGGAAQLYLYDAGGGEHISSDGTDLTINSGRNINLTCASGDVVIPADIGLTFGSGEKIEGDDTDLTVTSGGLITLTATGNTVVTNNALVSGTLTSTGVLSVDSTTDSTSTTTGSIHTDGGLGVVKDAYFGDDVNVNGSIATTDNNVSNTANTGRLSFEGSNVTQLGAWGADTSTGGILKFTTRSSDSSVNNVGIVIDGSGDVAIGTTAPAGALSVYGISRFSRQDSTPTGTANTVMNDAVFGSIETADTGITILGTGQIGIAFGNAASTEIGQIRYQHSSNAMEFRTNGNTAMTIDSAGSLLINDTVNTNMTIGLTINQAANDNEILALKSSDVAHAYTNDAETDTFYFINKANGSYGGTTINSVMEDAAYGTVLSFVVTGGTATTAKTTSGQGLTDIYMKEHDGSNGIANITADGNLFSIRARVGGGNLTRFLVDEDGDMWSVTTGATFDDYDDSVLLDSYDAIRSDYRKWTEQEEELLVKTGILGAPLSEGGLTCVTQLQRALVGNARQMASRLSLQQEEIESLKQELRLLKEAE